MAAYVIAFLEVTDSDAYLRYQEAAFPTVTRYGGRFLVAGEKTHVVEGMIFPKYVVVIEFGSLSNARQWYSSPEYEKTIPMRQRAANANLIITEGVSTERDSAFNDGGQRQ